jgi:hypothetical protein
MPNAIGRRLLAACLIPAMIGCGVASRQSIEGAVTFDGKPVPKGQIRFIPTSDAKGPTAGAIITDGRYVVDAERGLMPGRYRVEITATRPASEKTQAINPVTGAMETTEAIEAYIPARYNADSELIREVEADERNQLDFDLTSD